MPSVWYDLSPMGLQVKRLNDTVNQLKAQLDKMESHQPMQYQHKKVSKCLLNILSEISLKTPPYNKIYREKNIPIFAL